MIKSDGTRGATLDAEVREVTLRRWHCLGHGRPLAHNIVNIQ